MAQHIVKLKKSPVLELGSADMEFAIGDGDGKIGTLLISKGGIEWRPFKNKKGNRHFSWENFDKFIREHWGK
jgi:hypothetical protein